MDEPASTDGAETIMLLEVDVLARMTLAEYLRGCGYRVLEGTTLADVFAILEAGIGINVVLAEVRLGGDLEGLEIAKELRVRAPHIDVILTVGVGNAAEKAGQLCDEGPLEKPFHPQELVRRIQLLREKRRTGFPQQSS